jgi:(1->4)-alpha-D-glucan 1-alpha-D-glucosylmutase
MLATSTHDTKRGEDTRARLAVLSELPQDWAKQVEIWSRILRAGRGDVEGTAPPDPNDEYMFYQMLIGSWPVELLVPSPDAEGLAAYAERIKGALTKSLREAKAHSTWAAPNPAYEEAMLGLAGLALDPARSAAFLGAFLPFAERVARLGAQNSLAQTVLKLTLPGVPDIYQGTELWDLSLVDPDNRRPVDYALRQRLLEEILETAADDRQGAMARYLRSWRDARFKLAAMAAILGFRGEAPILFAEGDYEGLLAEGDGADEVCAFSRSQGDAAMLVAVARFPGRREIRGAPPAATLPVPESLQGGQWRELLTGRRVELGAELDAATLFREAPAAVFVRAE